MAWKLKKIIDERIRSDALLFVVIVALILSLSAYAREPLNGWWNDKPDCKGKYYRYFDFNDKLRYFMPGPKVEHMHVQPLDYIATGVYLDKRDNVKYVFDSINGALNIFWNNKDESRIWQHCSEAEVKPAYLNMMRAYLINRSYIDLAIEDNIYSGSEFLFQQCMLNFKNKNYSQAFDDCEFSWRSNNNGMAAYYMGQIYQWGAVGKSDYNKTFEWYTKSTTAGYPDAYGWLAWAYRFGKGTEIDLKLARKYYLISSNNGDTGSGLAAAKMLMLAEGGEVDYEHAEKLFQAAVDDDNLTAMTYLGVFYANGLSGKPEPVKAFDLIKRAADRNHIRAQFNLGMFYIHGIGVKEDKETGEKILKSLEQYSIIKQDKFLCAHDIYQPSAVKNHCREIGFR